MIYPFRFEPVFRRYLWGGRRLASVLNKPLGKGDDFAESWEIVDRPNDQSVIANGKFKGRTLASVLSEHPAAIMGRHRNMKAFPLLFKFLDCSRRLSVQVHPDDAKAASLDPPDLGKTEAWVVIAAEPGSTIYAGLKTGVDAATLAAAIDKGTLESCLHCFEPRAGDCIFIPAGVVHALGAGLLIAEIQQSSDTTYRLFDWNRVDRDGVPRPLHIEPALAAIDYQIGPISPQTPTLTEQPSRERLVACEKFVLDRLQLDQGESAIIELEDRVHVLAMLRGELDIDQDPDARPLIQGQSMMLPASLGKNHLIAKQASTLLDIYLP